MEVEEEGKGEEGGAGGCHALRGGGRYLLKLTSSGMSGRISSLGLIH